MYIAIRTYLQLDILMNYFFIQMDNKSSTIIPIIILMVFSCFNCIINLYNNKKFLLIEISMIILFHFFGNKIILKNFSFFHFFIKILIIIMFAYYDKFYGYNYSKKRFSLQERILIFIFLVIYGIVLLLINYFFNLI